MKLSEFTAKLIDAGGVHTTVVRQDGVHIPAIRFAEAFVLVSNPTNIEVFTYSIVERHDEEAQRVFYLITINVYLHMGGKLNFHSIKLVLLNTMNLAHYYNYVYIQLSIILHFINLRSG